LGLITSNSFLVSHVRNVEEFVNGEDYVGTIVMWDPCGPPPKSSRCCSKTCIQMNGVPQTHPSNGWVDPKVTHACPLARGNNQPNKNKISIYILILLPIYILKIHWYINPTTIAT